MTNSRQRRTLATIGMGVVMAGASALIAGPAHATTPDTTAAPLAGCPLHHKGTSAIVGFPGSDKWTEKFSNNCAHVGVRAKVVCENSLTQADSTHYGNVLHGDGSSSYTCDSIQHLERGSAQYYNGIKWIDIK